MHPPAYRRVDEPSDLLQALVVTAASEAPGTHRGADGVGRFLAHRREKADKVFPPAILGSAWTERLAQKVERDVVMGSLPVRILTVHNPSLLRVKLQTALEETLPNGT